MNALTLATKGMIGTRTVLVTLGAEVGVEVIDAAIIGAMVEDERSIAVETTPAGVDVTVEDARGIGVEVDNEVNIDVEVEQ